MPSLMDELRADQGRPTQCAVCTWIESRPVDEQEEWDQACADRAFTHASIHRAIVKRIPPEGYRFTRNSVEHHRNNGHRS